MWIKLQGAIITWADFHLYRCLLLLVDPGRWNHILRNAHQSSQSLHFFLSKRAPCWLGLPSSAISRGMRMNLGWQRTVVFYTDGARCFWWGNSITALETGGRGVVWFSSTESQFERCKRSRSPQKHPNMAQRMEKCRTRRKTLTEKWLWPRPCKTKMPPSQKKVLGSV